MNPSPGNDNKSPAFCLVNAAPTSLICILLNSGKCRNISIFSANSLGILFRSETDVEMSSKDCGADMSRSSSTSSSYAKVTTRRRENKGTIQINLAAPKCLLPPLWPSAEPNKILCISPGWPLEVTWTIVQPRLIFSSDRTGFGFWTSSPGLFCWFAVGPHCEAATFSSNSSSSCVSGDNRHKFN